MAGDTLFDKVIGVIDQDRQVLIDLCLNLGNLPDVSGHERPVGEAAVAWLEQAGIDAFLQFITDDAVNAVGILPGTRKTTGRGETLILCAHMDTEGVPLRWARFQYLERFQVHPNGKSLKLGGYANDLAKKYCRMYLRSTDVAVLFLSRSGPQGRVHWRS